MADRTIELAVDAVLFDNDGVLVDSHGETEQAWRQLAAEFDLPTDRVLVELVGVRAIDTLSQYLDGDQLTAAVDRLEDLEVGLADRTRPLTGALDLLAAVADHPWTIVTSATHRLASARWRGAGIEEPARAVTAESVTRGKPDPQPFQVGAELLGVEVSRCLVFEDSPSGGRAALAAGASVVAVGRQPWPVQPAARIDDLDAVSVETAASGHGLLIRLGS